MTSASRDMYSKKVGGGSPGLRPVRWLRVVLDAGAAAGRLDHLDIVGRALFEALRLEQPPRAVQLVEADAQVALDLLDRLQQRPGRGVT